MAADERSTVAALDAARAVFRGRIEANQGRLIDMAGDSVLAVFETAIGAVKAALAIQETLSTADSTVAEDRRMRFRIGVHLGDVIEKADGTVYGDGVNIAARLEGMAEPGGIAVSEAVHCLLRGRVSANFEDQGEQQLKNIPEPVRLYHMRAFGATTEAPTSVVARATKRTAVPVSSKPSIAVLPLTNMSGDPEQEYFSDGISEDLTMALSRFGWLFVIARNSAFTYKGKAVDVRQVGRELGVRYVLEGSVRRAGDRVRVSAQLVDAVADGCVWAEQFDRKMLDIFELQDEIVASIAATVAPEITSAEIERARIKRPNTLDAWDHYLQAIAAYHRMTEADIKAAISLLEQAIDLEPEFANAYALLARCHLDDWTTWMGSAGAPGVRNIPTHCREGGSRGAIESGSPSDVGVRADRGRGSGTRGHSRAARDRSESQLRRSSDGSWVGPRILWRSGRKFGCLPPGAARQSARQST